MAELIPHHRVHLVGVGGAGMSAIAKLLAGHGHDVTGSDLHRSEALASLQDLGLEVWSGHRPDRLGDRDLVVASSAVPDGDPELSAARAAGIVVWRRPELLHELTGALATIGATGTHGKSSTTAMLATALRAAGHDPSVVVGADLVEFRTNALVGAEHLLVLEADEAFGTFESLVLQGLVVTNVEADHLDHFGTYAEVESAFTRVARSVTGPVVACADDPGARRVAERVGTATYGTAADAVYRMAEVDGGARSTRFRLIGPEVDVEVRVPRSGIHVARNAAGALALMAASGYEVEAAAAGLADFKGIRRRFEHRGTVAGVSVIDDYAHHPTEVAATLREARSAAPRRLWAVFQPHLYSRTVQFAGEFGAALALADRVVVTDVYGARESPEPGVTGELVASAAVTAGAEQVDYVSHRADVAEFVARHRLPGDLVVVMGAGDITVSAGELLTLLGVGA